MSDLFSQTTPCASCRAPVRWISTASGAAMPIDPEPRKMIVLRPGTEIGDVVDAFVSHFATCPNASQHRKPR